MSTPTAPSPGCSRGCAWMPTPRPPPTAPNSSSGPATARPTNNGPSAPEARTEGRDRSAAAPGRDRPGGVAERDGRRMQNVAWMRRRGGQPFQQEFDGLGAHVLGGDVDGGHRRTEIFGPMPRSHPGDREVAGNPQAGAFKGPLDSRQCRFVDRDERGDLRLEVAQLL